MQGHPNLSSYKFPKIQADFFTSAFMTGVHVNFTLFPANLKKMSQDRKT